MNLALLIDSLSHPGAYPFTVEAVEVHQTHISVVFLAGPFAYKVKKPVNLGFLDFSSLEKRRHFCDEEVRLNRRLAAPIYLGVVPITRIEQGLRVEGEGEPVEWAVKMKRLPQDATLENRLQNGLADAPELKAVARKIALFHSQAQQGEHISVYGRFEAIARNSRENFEQAAQQVGTTVSRAVFDRLHALTEGALTGHRALMESRAARGVPRDTHGDLHLDHVYLFPDLPPPDNLLIVDCIEFNERFRYADPVADMAFLVMDLLFHGRPDLARAFTEEYFQASSDEEAKALLPFYVAYRAVVRGKVEGFELLEKEIPEDERASALCRARAHWLLALGELETRDRRPSLVLVGGLPGTGKSTLAQGLAAQAGFHLIRSDVVRKELAGLSAQQAARSPPGEGIYVPAWRDRTYAECLSRAEMLLDEGQRVMVDASFGEENKRLAFLKTAARLCVPAVFVHCLARPDVARRRLENRRGDASDANWLIHQQMTDRWEAIGPATQAVRCEISTDGTKEEALIQALSCLRQASLARNGAVHQTGSDNP